MQYKIIRSDITKYFRGLQWLVDQGEFDLFHAAFGDTPYFLGSIVERFGKEGSAAAQYGRDGAFGRLSAGFMGKEWDGFADVYHYQAWVTEWASLMLKLCYPGAVLALFGGTRTSHRVAAGLEDAGWVIQDCIFAWMYGSGFPKNHNTALDFRTKRRGWRGEALSNEAMLTMTLQDRLHWLKQERAYAGSGTALKPAIEPIIIARAPRRGYSFMQLADQFGTGLYNIDGTRIGYRGDVDSRTFGGAWHTDKAAKNVYEGGYRGIDQTVSPHGRYPANVVFSCECEGAHEPDCPVSQLDRQSGDLKAGGSLNGFEGYSDDGSVSRFFYSAKATKWEREAGLHGFSPRIVNDGRTTPIDNPYQRGDSLRKNTHPTVKPIELTTWLARLLLPPPQNEPRRLLNCFAGSGSEMIGAKLAGWDEVVGIERENEYADIAEARLAWWSQVESYVQAAALFAIETKQQQTGQVSMFEYEGLR